MPGQYTNEEWRGLLNFDERNPPIPSAHPVDLTQESLAQIIDHTLLKPDATPSQIEQLCDEALKYRFKSCCVNGNNIPLVARRLAVAGSPSIPCCVVGFPLGAMASAVKAFETSRAIHDGAREIDMVINIGALKAGDFNLVFSDIKGVADACRAASPLPYQESSRRQGSPAEGILLKVILETSLLSAAEIYAGSFIATHAGADFVKTSTGFGGGGADVADIAVMSQAVNNAVGITTPHVVGIKASGGVRTYEKCMEMVRAGASRIGTSSGVAILEQYRQSRTSQPLKDGPQHEGSGLVGY